MGAHQSGAEPWGEGAEPSAETVAARTELSPEQIRGMFNAVTSRHIGTMTVCAGLAYLGLAAGQWSPAMSDASLIMMSVYGLTAIALLAFAWRTKRHPLPVEWSIHAGGVVFMTVIGSVILSYAVGRDPTIFYLFILLQFAAGALLHSRAWLIASMVFADVAWIVISLFVDDVNWVRSIGYLAGFSVVVIGMHVVRRRTLIELHELREASEKVSRAKSEFLANTSHEVRTTISGVVGLGALLLETELDTKQRKMVSAIRESTEALIGIVDEVLDFSRLQQGQLKLDRLPFDLGATVDGVVELMEPRAEAKGLELEVTLGGLGRTRFVGDAGRIRQVVLNLVSNAIKFTEAGKVSVSAAVVRQSEPVRVRITVEDTGIGIKADALDKVFTRYQQQDRGTSRRFGGTGLGLAISKQLVELMGGELEVQSEVGVGTKFSIEIDLEPGPEDTLRVQGADGASDLLIRQGLRVLLAEDNPTGRMVTEALLKKLACEVRVVGDGREALRNARDQEYDIIFMDCDMPMMDGFQATRRIREDSKNQDTPIVALTASIIEDDRVRALEAGMNDTIAKPVRASRLQRLFAHWFTIHHDRAPSARSAHATPSSALDMRMVRQLVSLDVVDDGFIQEVMVAYIDQLRDSVKTLGNALDAEDMEAVKLTAHSIKGASKQIGASRVGELLGAIERETAVDPARDLVGQVAAEVPRVEEAVQALLRRHG
ncbi:MAG: ATP-binding protein [Polyangiales bacterium]